MHRSDGLRSAASARNTRSDVSSMGGWISGDRRSEGIKRKGKFSA